METEQSTKEQTGNVVKVSYQVLWRNSEAQRYLEEKLRNMKVGGELRVFEFNAPYFLRSFNDNDVNQILDSEEHKNRRYNKYIKESDLTYRIVRVK